MKEAKNMNPIIKDYIDDKKWMFPYIDSSLYTNYNYSQICNEERRRRLPLILNHKSHVSRLRDNLLQEYYNQHLPLKWLSCVADVSMPTFANHYTGSILLNHLIEQKASLFQTLFIENKQIDYHMWLQTSRIMYFGSQPDLKLSVGDVITGQSWIKRYFKKTDGKVHYGLGKTIITGCGIPVVQFPPVDSIAIDLPNVEIRNYHRNDDYIVNLSYPDYYKQMLNRYKNITILKRNY